MEKQKINDSTSSRRLLPLVYPGSPTTTNVPPAGNSHHNNYSRLHPFQHNPAATAHFPSQAGPGCKTGSSSYQQPPSLLSPTTHASAGVGGISNTVSQDIVSGSGWAAGSSSYQTPPSPLPQTYSSPSGGDSGGVVGLAPLTCTQPPFSWSVHQASSGSGLPAPLLSQSTASVDFGLPEEYVLPPLPPTLSGPPPLKLKPVVIDLEAVQYVDLEGPGDHLNSSCRDWGSSSTKAPCPPLSQPYSSGYTSTTQAPWTPLPLTPSSSMPNLVANFGVKKEAVDWSLGTSQLGKNNITIGGGSSSLAPQPYSSGSADLMVFESKPKQLPSPMVVEFADGSFTQDQIDKIMADKDLADIVRKDPKKVRRLLKNRITAKRSKQKRTMHLSDLELQVEQLQQENKSLCAEMNSLQSINNELTAENNEVMIKLNGSQQETQQKKALNQALSAEVQRLKLAVGEIRETRVSNSSYQGKSPQTMQPEHPKIHNHQLAEIQKDQELWEFENFIKQ